MTVRELDSPPSLTALYPRAVGMPLLRKLPGLGTDRELPDTELEVRDVETKAATSAAHQRNIMLLPTRGTFVQPLGRKPSMTESDVRELRRAAG